MTGPTQNEQEQNDRFGLQGAPEVQSARRIQFGKGQLRNGWWGGLLLLGLAFYAIANLFSLHDWQSQLGAVLALLCVGLGLSLWWRAKDRPINENNIWGITYALWYLLGYLNMKVWESVGRTVSTMPQSQEWILGVLVTLAIPVTLYYNFYRPAVKNASCQQKT